MVAIANLSAMIGVIVGDSSLWPASFFEANARAAGWVRREAFLTWFCVPAFVSLFAGAEEEGGCRG